MVSTFIQPDNTSQDGTTYKTSLDDAAAVFKRIAATFAPHAQSTPDMSVRVDAGNIATVGGIHTEVAAQNTETLTAPTTNPRKDIVTIDRVTGAVGVATGAEAVSPVDPTLPTETLVIARINLTVGMTEIANADIEDLRSVPLSAFPSDILTAKSEILSHNGINDVSIGVGTDGQVLTADSTDPNGVKWMDPASDTTDGVKITFTRQFLSNSYPALDINGTNLVISQTDPTVTLGGQARTVLSTANIPNTTPAIQQVIIDLPEIFQAGNYELNLTNTQGSSEVFISMNEVSLYDGSTWTQVTANADFSTRSSEQILSYDGKLWILGGYSGGHRNDIWSSTDGITWTEVTTNTIWPARNSHSAVVFDGKMWILGGHGGSYKNDVWYSTDGINWTEATSGANWAARGNFDAVVHDNKMWVSAGSFESGGHTTPRSDVWSSPDGITWTQASDGQFPARYGQSTLAYDNKLWMMAGYGGSYKSDVWSSPDGITWTEETSSAAWGGKYNSSAVVYDNKMWLMAGGQSGGSDVWSSTDGVTWSIATNDTGWGARTSANVTVFNNRIWLTGGEVGGAPTNDVWHTSA